MTIFARSTIQLRERLAQLLELDACRPEGRAVYEEKSALEAELARRTKKTAADARSEWECAQCVHESETADGTVCKYCGETFIAPRTRTVLKIYSLHAVRLNARIDAVRALVIPERFAKDRAAAAEAIERAQATIKRWQEVQVRA